MNAIYTSTENLFLPFSSNHLVNLYGIPIQKSHDEMAVALKRCIFDHMFVKPKYIGGWGGGRFFFRKIVN